jgi:predicted metal-dependent peptidase
MVRKIDKRLEAALARIITRDLAYASILLSVEIRHNPGIETACTNGVSIEWNPAYLDEIRRESSDDAEALEKTMGVSVHEARHIMQLHPWRRQGRDPELWNIACDHEINLSMGSDKNPYVLPKGALADKRFQGMAAEQIYNVLFSEAQKKPQQNPQQGQGTGQGKPQQGQGKPQQGQGGSGQGQSKQNAPQGKPAPGKGQGQGQGQNAGTGSGKSPGKHNPNIGGVVDCPGTQAEVEEAKARTIIEIIRAAETAKSMGQCPGFLEQWVTALVNPKVPWQHELRDYLLAKAADEYSWSRPNMRWLEAGFYFPSKRNYRCGTIAVVFDTSGSIGQKEVDEFASELSGIMRDMKPERIVFCQCDADISDWQIWEDETEIPGGRVKIKGGGGTSFIPPFHKLEEEQLTPDVLIYFTDGYGTFPKAAEFPVVWAMTTDVKAPFGHRIQIDLNN